MGWFEGVRMELERGLDPVDIDTLLHNLSDLLRLICTPTRSLLASDYMWYKRFDKVENIPEMDYDTDEELFLEYFVSRLEALHEYLNEHCAKVNTLKPEVF